MVPEAKANRHPFLVLGGDGQLGASLVSRLRESGRRVFSTVFLKDPGGADEVFLDLRQGLSSWQIPGPCDVAFLCAAITSTEICRTQPQASRKVNVENTLAVARRLSEAGAALFFPSTNLVFDGMLPYRKANDPVAPRCEYGKQKVETEQGLAALTDRVAVIRFSKIIGPNMALLKNWTADLQQERTIHPFSDMCLSPVSLGYAVETILSVMAKRRYGLWQVSARQDVTYEALARHLARKIGASQELIQPVEAARSDLQFETIPEHTTLDTSRLKEELGLEVPSVWDAVDEIFL
jgi:dTDP-4-dehydrorhamnose reductase